MHEGTPTDRDPSPAARVGYHSGKRLATTIARRIAATVRGGCQAVVYLSIAVMPAKAGIQLRAAKAGPQLSLG